MEFILSDSAALMVKKYAGIKIMTGMGKEFACGI